MTIWNYLLAALASMAAEPDAIEAARPRAAAAVAVAAASMTPGEPTPADEAKMSGECEGDECEVPKTILVAP